MVCIFAEITSKELAIIIALTLVFLSGVALLAFAISRIGTNNNVSIKNDDNSKSQSVHQRNGQLADTADTGVVDDA